MHTMKKQVILIALLILAMLSAAMVSVSAVDEVAIDESNFPDEKFREYVKRFDTDNDGYLTAEERNYYSGWGTSEAFTSVKGIEYFTELTYLALNDGGYLTEIDLSKNTKLQTLELAGNQLTTLDLTANPALTTLRINNNRLLCMTLNENTQIQDIYPSDQNGYLDLTAYSPADGYALSNIPGMDGSKISNLVGATLNDEKKILFVPEGTESITYTYDCGAGVIIDFTAQILWPAVPVVAIDSEHFPDDIFRAWVSTNVDKGEAPDGILTNHEIAAVTEIDFGFDRNTADGDKIANLTGIEYFTSLTFLNASYCKLSKLDVSKLTNLTYLNCNNNQELKALDVSHNTKLTYLFFDSSSSTSSSTVKLQSLDIDHLVDLQTLSVRYAAIPSLDLSMMPDLTRVNLEGSSVVALKLDPNVKLTKQEDTDFSDLSYMIDLGEATGTAEYKLSNIPGMDGSKISNLVGATLNDSKDALLIPQTTQKVTYTYDCGAGYSIDCTIAKKIKVQINATNFPDPVFMGWVKERFDKDNDGWLSSDEVSGSSGYNTSYQFSNIKGIEYLPNLTQFVLNDGGTLTEVDLSQNTKLTKLGLADNKLTSLDLSANDRLYSLDVSGNRLLWLKLNDACSFTSVDVSNQTPGRIDLRKYTSDAVYPLSSIPGMDGSKISNLVGATLSADKTTLNIPFETEYVTYTYDCGAGVKMDCTAELMWPIDDVVINEKNFPDKVFRNYIKQKIDNGDGILTGDEIHAVTEINLSLNDTLNDIADNCVKTLTGIEHFTSLEKLLVEYNMLEELDVTALTKLRELGCGYNLIAGKLDLSKNTYLEQVVCSNNMITEIDFGECAANLFYLDCEVNQLTVLDLTRLPALEEVYCHKNQIEKLDPTKCPDLTHLYANNNDKITSLDLSENTELERIYVQNLKNLAELDLSNNKNLREIHLENTALTTVDFTGFSNASLIGLNGTPVTSIKLNGTTNLTYFSAERTQLHCISFPDSPLSSGVSLQNSPLFAIHFAYKPQQKIYISDTETTVELTENNGVYTFDLASYGVIPSRVTPVDTTSTMSAAGVLTVPVGTPSFTYTYDCGHDITLTVTLKFSWENLIANIFPDAVFRAYVSANYDTNRNGVLESEEALAVTEMTIPTTGGRISKLTGIEYFPNLQKLNVSGHNISSSSSIDLSKNTELVSLDVSNNSLSWIDISMLTKLEEFNCSGNRLGSLNLKNNTQLKVLNCSNNQLTSLSLSKNKKLTTLKCSNNRLSYLDVSSHEELTTLECVNNPLYACYAPKPFATVSSSGSSVVRNGNTVDLGALNGINSSRVNFLSCDARESCKCKYDSKTGLLTLEGAVKTLTYEYQYGPGSTDTITVTLDVYAPGELLKLSDLDPVLRYSVQAADTNKDGYMTPAECALVTSISLSKNNGIARSLKGIENFTELTSLSCSGHAIEVLDLSKNNKLRTLNAFNQNDPNMPQKKLLRILILPEATNALTTLNVYDNALTELDVSRYTALQSLRCQNNQLTLLKAHPNLQELYCGNNRMTALDLTQNVGLTYLRIENDRYLTRVALPYSAALKTVYVRNCVMPTLDFSRTPGVTNLTCTNNNFTAGLDLRPLTKLERLDCKYSNLPSLLLPKSDVLTNIQCYNNALTSLDVTMLIGLQTLNCNNNSLSTLDLSGNPALQTLQCDYNKLTSMDFSHNRNLTRLYVRYNQINFLDTRMLEKLSSVSTTGNPMLGYDKTMLSPVVGGSGESAYVFRVGADNKIDLKALYGERLKNVQSLRIVRYNGETRVTVDQNTGIVTLPEDAQIIQLNYKYAGLDYGWSIGITCDILRTDTLIDINATNFPDPLFRAWVEKNADTNGDKKLSVPETEAWTEITLMKMGGKMNSIKGIEHFKNLTSLNVYGNMLTQLDLSQNLALEELICAGNALTNLDLTANEKLRFLDCSDNCLTSLTLGANTNLRKLECYYNYLTKLNVSECTNLESLICYRNSLTDLTLGSHAMLRELDCSYNRLTVLDVSRCTSLSYLDCRSNNLNTLKLYTNDAENVMTDPITSNRVIDIQTVTRTRTMMQPMMLRSRSTMQSVSLAGIPDFDITKLRLTEEQENMGIVIDTANQMISFPMGLDEITCNYLISEHFATVVTFRMTTSAIMINEVNFPDDALRTFAATQDSQTDYALTDTERANIVRINLPASTPVKDLSGIGLFPNLESLDCTGSQLSDGTWGLTGLPSGTVSQTAGATISGNTLTVARGVREVTLTVQNATLTIHFPYNVGDGEIVLYTITFDTDGGTEIAPVQYPAGATVTAPAEPTKEGFVFDGWEGLPENMPAENITVKAKWVAEKNDSSSSNSPFPILLTAVTQVKVVDAETEAALPGATFALYRINANGTRKLQQTFTSNATGRFTARTLSPRFIYELVMVSAPEGYNLIEAPVVFTVQYNLPLYQTIVLTKAGDMPADAQTP